MILMTIILMFIPSAGTLEGLNVCKRYKSAISDERMEVKVEEKFCCAGFKPQNNRCVECHDCIKINCPSGFCGTGCVQQCNCPSFSRCDSHKCCICNAGKTGRNCDQTCSRGYFGENCTARCSCSEHSTCNVVNGECLCNEGWTGYNCTVAIIKFPNSTCPSNCDCTNSHCTRDDCQCSSYNDNHTDDNSTDASVTISACEPGFFGKNCSESCIGKPFDPQCKPICNCNESQTCDRKFGCVCVAAGYTGNECRTVCPSGLFGPGCRQRCSCSSHANCDPVNGSCACHKGYIGQYCTKPCPPGTYRRNCVGYCSCPECDPVTGACTAQPTTSENVCPSGFYGPGCLQHCACSSHADCNRFDGSCECHKGYKGQYCDEHCSDGYYGEGCSSRCSCPNNLPCHHEDGTCLCPKGLMGSNCDIVCPTRRYGAGCIKECTCEHGSCEPKDGNCTCLAGWSGLSCNEHCPSQTYGMECSLNCTCSKDSECDHVTGECLCPLGLFGRNCDKPCDPMHWGGSCKERCLCSNTSTCNPTNGRCHCASGWTGTHCTHMCNQGYYGDDCLKRCACSTNQQCHHVTGICTCIAGRKGIDCSEKCLPGTYGSNCEGKCSCSDCDPVTGACSAKPSGIENGSIGIIIGAVIAFLVLVMCLGFLILRHRHASQTEKRLQNKSSENTGSNHYEDIDAYAEIADVPDSLPYNYAYTDDFKPPVKERIPTIKKTTNQYMSLTETERLSKLLADGNKTRSTEYLNPYTGLLKNAKCGSYQEIMEATKGRSSSGSSSVSESGYLKPTTGKAHDKKTKLSSNDYTDAKASVRYSNSKEVQQSTRPGSGSSSQSEKGYLHMTASIKKIENRRVGMIETTSPKTTEELSKCQMTGIVPDTSNQEDNCSHDSVFLPVVK